MAKDLSDNPVADGAPALNTQDLTQPGTTDLSGDREGGQAMTLAIAQAFGVAEQPRGKGWKARHGAK